MGGLVHELKELLAENFMSPQLKYVPTECNHVAHELTSLGSMSVEETSSVMAGVPDCILYLVSSDSADMVG
jgi:hypothetical protein